MARLSSTVNMKQILILIGFLCLSLPAFAQAGQATRIARTDPTGTACDSNSPILQFGSGIYTCQSSTYALTSTRKATYTLAQLSDGTMPCAAGNKGQSVDVSDGNKGQRTCRNTTGSTYAWVDDSGVYDVTRYGAIANDGVDDTAAVQAAFAAMVATATTIGIGGWSGATQTLYFPAGKYNIATSSASALVPAAGLGMRGVLIKGDGAGQSVITVSGSTSYYFLYNDNSIAFSGFEDISFVGATGSERLMYYNSAGTAQEIRRKGVHVYNFSQLYNIAGSGNADLNVHIDCDDVQYSSSTLPWIRMNNTQSVVHTFVSVHMVIWYRGLEVVAGGQVNWYGGSVLINGTNYFVHLDDATGAGIGSQSGEFGFTGLKTELRDTAKLLYVRAPGARVVFRDCGLTTRWNDPADAIHIERMGEVSIQGGSLDYKITLTTQNDTYADSAPALIKVRDVQISRAKDVLVTISHTGANVGGKGKAIFQGCTLPQSDGTWPTLTRVPADGTIGYDQAFSNATRPEFIAIYQALADGRGLTNATSTTFTLPKNCFVTEVIVVNTSSAAKQWRITGPSGAVWLTTASGSKYNRASVMEEVGSSNTFSVENITDNTFADGYIVIKFF